MMRYRELSDKDSGEPFARRLHRILQKYGAEHLLSEGLLLDLGCGDGTVTTAFKSEFPYTQVIGIDNYLAYLLDAKKISQGQVYLIRGDAKNLPVADNSIPVIFSNYIYDFYNEQTFPEIAREVYRVLKHGGIYLAQDNNLRTYEDPLIDLGLDILEEKHPWYVVFQKGHNLKVG